MLKQFLILLFLLFTSNSVLAQSGFSIASLQQLNDDERAFLRKGFKLDDSSTVEVTKSALRSTLVSTALKVNLESILDPNVRKVVLEWIGEWNQKDASKYGPIEIVTDCLHADVTLVRYLRSLPSTDPISAMTWTDQKGKTHRLIPVYSYLMMCKPNSLEILWRKVDLTYSEEYESSGKVLANALKSVVKARTKH
jgi:hypothetical protein